jgi:monomeric isocitrate dehydrogenase
MYTHTDKAPMLATYSLLPVLRAYCRFAGVKIMKKAGRSYKKWGIYRESIGNL